jgi:hypothetical protein
MLARPVWRACRPPPLHTPTSGCCCRPRVSSPPSPASVVRGTAPSGRRLVLLENTGGNRGGLVYNTWCNRTACPASGHQPPISYRSIHIPARRPGPVRPSLSLVRRREAGVSLHDPVPSELSAGGGGSGIRHPPLVGRGGQGTLIGLLTHERREKVTFQS